MFSNATFSDCTLTLKDFFDDRTVRSDLRKSYKRKAYKFTNDVFMKHDRITYPITFEIDHDVLLKDNQEYTTVKNFLALYDYDIVDYFAGTCKKSDSSDKRIHKIGKILTQNNASAGIVRCFVNGDLRKGSRLAHEQCVVTVSRNLVDIAAMSTKRGWASCMNLEDEDSDFNHYVYDDIKKGTHIMYLHKAEDTEIRNPIGRILLKPYRCQVGNKERTILVPEMSSYGFEHEKFHEMATAWCRMTYKKKYMDNTFIKDDDLYDDGSSYRYYVVDSSDASIPFSDCDSEKKMAYIRDISDTNNIRLFAYDDFPEVRLAALKKMTNEEDMVNFLDDTHSDVIYYLTSNLKSKEYLDYVVYKNQITETVLIGLQHNYSINSNQMLRYIKKCTTVNYRGISYHLWRFSNNFLKKLGIKDERFAYQLANRKLYDTPEEWIESLGDNNPYTNFLIFGKLYAEDKDFIKYVMEKSDNLILRIHAVVNSKIYYGEKYINDIPEEFLKNGFQSFREAGRPFEVRIRGLIMGDELEGTIDLADFFPIEEGKYVLDCSTLTLVSNA